MIKITRLVCAAVLGTALLLPLSPDALAQGAFVERVATSKALVHDVDLKTRQVLLETEDGRFVTLVAPEEVRNLPQLKAGDTLNIGFYGGIAAALAPAGQEPQPTTREEVLMRAAEGEKPAGAVASELVTTVTFQDFNADTSTVTFTGQSGITRSVVVESDEMRAFVETLEPGDQVDVVVVEILAIETDQ
jgi:hypothetical protein